MAVSQINNKMPKAIKDRKNYTMYNETLYEVERVVQIKWVKNRQYCLIKWKGYDENFNTWQPKEHITFCYNYVAPEEPEDDPEYHEVTPVKVPHTHPINKHQYHTRGKIKPKDTHQKTPQQDSQEKDDNTHLEDVASESMQLQYPKNWKPFCERNNNNELELKPKREEERTKPKALEEEKTSSKVPREAIITKILWLNYEEASEKRIGKVEMEDGKIAYMYEDILKARFPEKVIEYYEKEMRQSRTQKE